MMRPANQLDAITDPRVVREFVKRMSAEPGAPHPESGVETQCWMWAGVIGLDGYGKFFIRRVTFRAHRVSYAIWNGPIGFGETIHHRCLNPRCVNPAHLEVMSNSDNVAERNRRIATNGVARHGQRSRADAVEEGDISHLPV